MSSTMKLLRQAVGHLIVCKDAARLISQLEDRRPTGWEGFRLRAHLAICAYCRRFEQQVKILRSAMQRYRS